jgi:hypothetical protein
MGNVSSDRSTLIAISTIDPKTKQNRFYQKLIDAEAAMADYQDIDTTVFELRHKY